MFKVIVFTAGWMAATAFAAEVFGQSGANGRNAQQGIDGSTPERLKWNVDGSNRSFSLIGTDGGDASGQGQNGSSADYCNPPHEPNYNLVGARGGNGGNGARGGNGGNGGDIIFYISGSDKIPLLKKITLKNKGGKPGFNAPFPGSGATGCMCEDYQWEKRQCHWILYQIIPAQNGQSEQKVRRDTATTDCSRSNQAPYNRGNGFFWELDYETWQRYSCRDGATGSNGNYGGEAQHGSYGNVSVILGATSETKSSPRLDSIVSEVIGKTYLFSGADNEPRTGLRALLASGSDVADTFSLRKFFQRKVKLEWRPKLTPQEAGVDKQRVVLSLEGKASAPTVGVWLGTNKVTYRVTNKDDTTTVAFTHILNSTDPVKIAACTKNSGKGAYLCTFSEQCIYEDGDCLPK
jgi:hypothetical protein